MHTTKVVYAPSSVVVCILCILATQSSSTRVPCISITRREAQAHALRTKSRVGTTLEQRTFRDWTGTLPSTDGTEEEEKGPRVESQREGQDSAAG
jgi:hypothetical protein